MSITIALIGYKIFRRTEEEEGGELVTNCYQLKLPSSEEAMKK